MKTLLILFLANASSFTFTSHRPLYRKHKIQLHSQPQPSPEEFLKITANAPKSAKTSGGIAETLLSQNNAFLDWLSEEGDLHLKPTSTWFEPPHPVAISIDTRNVDTNESSGRGVVARVDIPQGGEVLRIPLKLCMGIDRARDTFGASVIPSDMNEYVAIALLLVREKFVLSETSYFKPYMDILPPTVESVSPTFTWSEEELDTLKGSPLLPATRSLMLKLKSEYDRFVVPLVESSDDRFASEFYNVESWNWAFTMMFSRAVRMKNNMPDNEYDIEQAEKVSKRSNERAKRGGFGIVALLVASLLVVQLTISRFARYCISGAGADGPLCRSD